MLPSVQKRMERDAMSQRKSGPTRPRQRRVTAQSKAPSSSAPKPQAKPPTLPEPDDLEGWKRHWEERQQPWRTKPVIAVARQHELETRYKVVPDIEQGIYPFRGMKLSRADVEWLLATYKDS